jgi:hypothetical protein
MKMTYYECMFRAVGSAYSMMYYDLPSDNEEEVLEILKSEGFEVLEIYGIKEQ